MSKLIFVVLIYIIPGSGVESTPFRDMVQLCKASHPQAEVRWKVDNARLGDYRGQGIVLTCFLPESRPPGVYGDP